MFVLQNLKFLTCSGYHAVPLVELHFRLITFDAIKLGTKEKVESSCKIVSMQ